MTTNRHPTRARHARKRPIDADIEPIFVSSSMRRVEHLLGTLAPKDVTLTLLGESGTGKEILARRAHELSTRRAGPFVPINCAAIPEALFESELFGHEKGAFTGANVLAVGKVQAAEGGTLFLDEIGELPLASQAKLLRFLESRKFMRVGGTKKIDADVRLIVATLRPLEDEVRSGRFRADLYYRIQGIVVAVPPLRERRAAIGPMLARFAEQLSQRHGVATPRFDRQAKRLLLAYDWPGNVRELRNVVERLCLLRSGRTVRPSDLPGSIHADAPPEDVPTDAPSSQLTLDVDEGYAALTTQIFDHALALEGGHAIRAAARLGIAPRTMQRYLARGRTRG